MRTLEKVDLLDLQQGGRERQVRLIVHMSTSADENCHI